MRRLALLIAALALWPAPAASAATTAEENALPGTPGWERPEATGRAIEGYTAQVSAVPGRRLGLHVSTSPRARYRVEILRFGWYGGAGARRVACLPDCTGDLQGTERPMPPPQEGTGMVEAGWPAELEIPVGGDWTSGLYAASLVLTSGEQAGAAAVVPFVVRDPDPADGAILVQMAVNTWQAYNTWGGKSLYTGPRASKVSFARPFAPSEGNINLMTPSAFDAPFIRFAEREGYELSYSTDVDVHRDPGVLLEHRAAIPLGHDEYWTKAQRDALERARDRGVHLAFLGANQGYWQSRYEDGQRTLVVYRSAAADPETDPALETIRFRDLDPPRPECELLGVQFLGGRPGSDGGGYGYVVEAGAPENPWVARAGFAAGDLVARATYHELDSRVEGCGPPGLRVLFRREGSGAPGEAVHSTAPSGAEVFSAGTLGFIAALDDGGRRGGPADPRVQAFVRAMLDDFVDRVRPPAPAPETGGPGPGAGPDGPAPPGGAPPDVKRPVVRLASRRLRASRRGRVTVRLGASGEPATGTVTLRRGATRLARARVRLRTGTGRAVRLRLSARARRLLTRRGRAAGVVLVVSLTDRAGNTTTRRFRATLRPAPRRR